MPIEIVKAKPQAPSKFLVIGEPFSGKTTLASKAPRPLFLSTDGNAAKSGLDAINIKTAEDVREAIGYAMETKEYETIVVDTIEGISDVFTADVLREFSAQGMKAEGGKKLEALTDIPWGKGTGALNKKLSSFAEVLANLDKNVIVLSYTKRQIDEVSGSIILASELKNIRLLTRFMDAQVITSHDGEKYQARIISKREVAAGEVDLSKIESFLGQIGWELPKKKVKVGKVNK